MQVDDLIRHRRSIRRYLPDAVPATVIRELLGLATQAPNIGNRQLWRYIVVTDPPLRLMLAHLVHRKLDEVAQWPSSAGQTQRIRAWRESASLFAEAPAAIFFVNQGYRLPFETILVGHGMKSWEIDEMFGSPGIQSISSAIAYLTLLAESRGYGACWLTDLLIGQHDLHAALDLHAGEKLVAVLALGRPAEAPPPKPRKSIDEMIEWR